MSEEASGFSRHSSKARFQAVMWLHIIFRRSIDGTRKVSSISQQNVFILDPAIQALRPKTVQFRPHLHLEQRGLVFISFNSCAGALVRLWHQQRPAGRFSSWPHPSTIYPCQTATLHLFVTTELSRVILHGPQPETWVAFLFHQDILIFSINHKYLTFHLNLFLSQKIKCPAVISESVFLFFNFKLWKNIVSFYFMQYKIGCFRRPGPSFWSYRWSDNTQSRRNEPSKSLSGKKRLEKFGIWRATEFLLFLDGKLLASTCSAPSWGNIKGEEASSWF